MQFATRLKKWMAEKDLTQAEVADRLNVAQSTVGCWVAGSRRPSLDLLDDICTALGVTPAEFYMNETESAAVKMAEFIFAQARQRIAATGTDGASEQPTVAPDVTYGKRLPSWVFEPQFAEAAS